MVEMDRQIDLNRQSSSEGGSDDEDNVDNWIERNSSVDDRDDQNGSVPHDQEQAMGKRPLSKQPSNGIHVLTPDGLKSADTPQLANEQEPTNKEQSEEISFDPNGSYYMANACCELVHYRNAAILVGITEFAMLIGWAVLIGIYYKLTGGLEGIGSTIAITVQAVAAVAFLTIIVLMLVGVHLERPMLLWPHMIVQIGGIGCGIGLTVVAVVAMCAGTTLAETIFSGIFGEEKLPFVEKSLGPIWPFCLAVVFDFGAALGIWFYIVVKGCYEYLMDKAFFENQENTVHNLALKKEKLGVSLKKSS